MLIILVTLVLALLLRRRSAQPAPAPAGAIYSPAAGMQPQAGFPQPMIGQPSNPPMYQPAAAPGAPTPWYSGTPDGTVLPGMPAQAGAPQAGMAYPSDPHAYQAAPTPGAYSNGYSAPAGNAPMMPPAGMQPGIGHPSGPSAYQQAQAPAASQCANGHPVQDPNAQFCPTCGAPVHHTAYHP